MSSDREENGYTSETTAESRHQYWTLASLHTEALCQASRVCISDHFDAPQQLNNALDVSYATLAKSNALEVALVLIVQELERSAYIQLVIAS